MSDPLVTLILSSAVIMGSPGPSTMSVTAVGAAYGFRRSLKYTWGLIAGTAAVLVSVALGVAAVVNAVPQAAPVLTGIAIAYTLYLAYRIASAPPLAGRVAAPAFFGGVLLAIANPKAYLAIAAVFAGTTISADDRTFDTISKIVLLSGMIVLIHVSWLLAGASLSRLLHQPRSARIVNVTMAACLVVTMLLAFVS